jgi:hypothetical protein
MRGPDVRAAQILLKEYGAWTGKIDGIFGEQTARACAQAKWRLGYRTGNILPTYGPTLNNYLMGKKKPSVLMRRRSDQRKKSVNVGEIALSVANQYLGMTEKPPGSNHVLFAEWYGIIGPWCAMFVTYCFVKAGAKHFQRGNRWAYCPFVHDDARNQRNGLTIVPKEKVRAGDIVLFDWNDDGTADHIGIVIDPPGKKNTYTTIEGNTSGTNPSDGGMVAIQPRNMSDTLVFIRVWE